MPKLSTRHEAAVKLFVLKEEQRNFTRRQPNITAKQFYSPQANIIEKSTLSRAFFWWGRVDSPALRSRRIHAWQPITNNETHPLG